MPIQHQAVTFNFFIKPQPINKNKSTSTFKYDTSKADWNKFEEKLLNNITPESLAGISLEHMNETELDKLTD